MKNQVHIGQLDRRVGLYNKTYNKAANGEEQATLTLYKNAWAMAEDKSASEVEAGKIYLNAIRNYTIRFDSIINTSGEEMVIRDLDGDYHIAGISHIGRKQFLTLKAVKRE